MPDEEEDALLSWLALVYLAAEAAGVQPLQVSLSLSLSLSSNKFPRPGDIKHFVIGAACQSGVTM